MAKHEIITVSFWRDFPWLVHCLRSVQKFCEGYDGVTICIPDSDVRLLSEQVLSRLDTTKGPNFTVRTFAEPVGKGMLQSMIVKCRADEYCPRADFIHIFDSDFLVCAPTKPEDNFVNGKPLLTYNSYATLAAMGNGATVWQVPTERALGFPVQFEYMRRVPFVYPREVFQPMREHIERVQRRPFDEFMLAGRNSWPQEVCECNQIGAYIHRFMPDLMHWSSLDGGGGWPNTILQMWSHGGLDRPVDQRFSFCGFNLDGKTPRQVITEVLGSL